VKPCGPGTRCWCQIGGGSSARPGPAKPQSADDGDKTNSSPGRARNKPLKPLRAGMPGCSGGPVVTNSCAFYTSHARLRVHWAPGIPHALLGRIWFLHDSGASRRGNANTYLAVIARSEATKQSMLSFCGGNGLLRFARNDGSLIFARTGSGICSGERAPRVPSGRQPAQEARQTPRCLP
jgi:hypothetical protein